MRIREESSHKKLTLGQLGNRTRALIQEHGEEIVRTARSMPSLKLQDMMKSWKTEAQNIWDAMDYFGVYEDWKASRRRTAVYDLERKYPDLKEFCRWGCTLQEMADYYEVKKQAVHRVCGLLKYDVKREKARGEIKMAARKEARDRVEKGRVLVSISGEIERIAMEKAGTEAERKALKYHFERMGPNNGVPFDNLVKLFEVYYSHKAAGEKVGFHTIAKEAGISCASRARDIVMAVGEKSLVFTKDKMFSRMRFGDVDKRKMAEAVRHKGVLSLGDLVEITGFAKFSLYHHAQEAGIHSDDCRGWGVPCGGANIGYTKAMKFYWALDSGASIYDAGECAGIKKRGILQRLVDKRETIEPAYMESKIRVEEAVAAVRD